MNEQLAGSLSIPVSGKGDNYSSLPSQDPGPAVLERSSGRP